MNCASRTTPSTRRLSRPLLNLVGPALLGALVVGPAWSATYSEAVNGDFSNLYTSPSAIVLDLGSNLVSGMTGDAGAGVDRDYFTFTLSAGQQLTAINVLAGTHSLGRSFFGIAAGSQMIAPEPAVPGPPSAVGLLGWTLFSASDIGTDILDDLGAASPPDFPVFLFPGATGFSGPLGAGSYSLWIQDSDPGSASYNLKFSVGSVPEPASWALLLVGFGIIGTALRRSRKAAGAMSLWRAA